MEPHITEQELLIAETYLNKAEAGELNNGQFSKNDVKHTHPVLLKLIQYGVAENKLTPAKDRKENYEFILNMGDDGPEHLLHFALTNPDTMRALAKKYRDASEDAERHRIFSKKLSDMTGYEYQKFKKMIGE